MHLDFHLHFPHWVSGEWEIHFCNFFVAQGLTATKWISCLKVEMQ